VTVEMRNERRTNLRRHALLLCAHLHIDPCCSWQQRFGNAAGVRHNVSAPPLRDTRESISARTVDKLEALVLCCRLSFQIALGCSGLGSGAAHICGSRADGLGQMSDGLPQPGPAMPARAQLVAHHGWPQAHILHAQGAAAIHAGSKRTRCIVLAMQTHALIRNQAHPDASCQYSNAAFRSVQDVAFERRSPDRLRRVQMQATSSEQVPALQNSENGNGTPPEDDTLKGCSQSTMSVHGGERAGRPRVSDSLITPLVQVSGSLS